MPTEISGSTGVDKIQDGTVVNADINSSAAIAGSKLVMPAGSIIQVVHATDIVATAVASTSYTDIGLSASITPQTNSKVLIIADLQTHLASGNYGYWVQLMRDSTVASSNVATDPSVSYYDANGSTDVRQQSTFTFLDSSVGGNGSTSKTYKIQAKTVAGRSVAFSASEAPAMITLMEIAG